MRGAALGLVTTAFALTGEARATHTSSGLRGVVTRGTKPVCRDDACEEPAADVVLRFARNGRVVAETTTTKTGRYFVKLAAGSYVVTTPRRPPAGTGLAPRIVGVHRGQIDAVDFHLDTGVH